MRAAIRSLARALVPIALVALGEGCRTAPAIPKRAQGRYEHALDGVPLDQRSELWVSYQIEVAAIDGAATDYRAEQSGLYYCIALRAGEHRLGLRLEYAAPLQEVRSDSAVEIDVSLAAGESYRLIDLNAGRKRGRVFTPWLIGGAPEDERIELERPTTP